MVLRTLVGDGPSALVPSTPLDAARIVLAGARSFDAAETVFVAENGVRSIAAADVSGATLIEAVEATGATSVYIHVDLDVLDPSDIVGLGYPEPFGVRASTLVDSIKQLLERFPLAGAGITEFAPASPAEAVEDMPTILRLVGALAAAL
jgi:arginase